MEGKASNPNSPLHQALNLNLSRASASSPPDFLQPNFSRADKEKKWKNTKKSREMFSAVSVDRTRDLQIFSLTLSQLSYPRRSRYIPHQVQSLYIQQCSKKFFHTLYWFKSCTESFQENALQLAQDLRHQWSPPHDCHKSKEWVYWKNQPVFWPVMGLQNYLVDMNKILKKNPPGTRICIQISNQNFFVLSLMHS